MCVCVCVCVGVFGEGNTQTIYTKNTKEFSHIRYDIVCYRILMSVPAMQNEPPHRRRNHRRRARPREL